jgi:hypothetical protein
MLRKDKGLNRRLEDAYRTEPPESLYRKLIEIPDKVPQPERPPARPRAKNSWLNFRWPLAVPALSVAAAIALLWTAGTRIPPENPAAPPDRVALTSQEQAVRDFVVVMTYLQASTSRVNREVQTEIGAGLMAAFERGEQSFKDSSKRVTNGG